MSVGAAAMDSKALSVLSMQTLQEVGKGESSKIFFPMEVTKLVEGISDYVGSARSVPDREVSDVEGIREAVGSPDDILGPIPSMEEIKAETEKLDRMMKDDMDDVNEIISKEPKV
jgi:hypothetical protein